MAIPLVAKTAREARKEIKQRWPNNDVNYMGYDKFGHVVLISMVRNVTQGGVATARKNGSIPAVIFAASPV